LDTPAGRTQALIEAELTSVIGVALGGNPNPVLIAAHGGGIRA
jgi:hypothetical protein